MDWYKKLFILLLPVPLFFGACISLKQPKNKVEFYTLEYDSPRIEVLHSTPLAIRMERFSVAPAYNSNRIIYRDGSFKRNSYAYYKWRVNPGDLVTSFLTRDIKQSGLFKAVLPHDSRFPSSYIIEGSVDEFFESDKKINWEAVLSVGITLMAENEPDITKKVLYQKTYHARKICKQKNPQGLAKAMSTAMAEISGKIIEDIYCCIETAQ